jgi:hypothetical protein
MAIGYASDFSVFQDQFFGGMYEVLTQQADVFNAASMNAIRLISAESEGDYQEESFFKSITSLVTRRDPTSTTGVTSGKLEQGLARSVKVHRKIGPIENTKDSFRKLLMRSSPEELSFRIGQQAGTAVAVDYVNSAVRSVDAAIAGSALNVAATGANITYANLISMLALMGDRASRVVAWVMHSKPFFDLMGQSLTDKITNVADVAIWEGGVGSFGRPIIVTDSADLVTSGTPDTYRTLGLVENGCTLIESEEREIASQDVLGNESMTVIVQGEHAFNIGCKGFQWDATNGGANPLDAALATSTNWDKVATDDKDLAGVGITTN